MAIRPASRKDAQIIVGAYDMSSALDVLAFKQSAVLVNFNALGSASPTVYDTGERFAELSCSGLPNTHTTVSHIATQIATVKFDSDVLDRRCFMFPQTTVSDVGEVIAAGDINRVETTFSISGEFNHGYIVAPLVARTDSGSTDATYCDSDAAVVNPATAHALLHVTGLALGGYANCLIKVRDSADGDAHADHTAFTAVTGGTAELKTLTGGVGRYISVSWLWQGGSPSGGHSITFTVAYARD